MHEWLEVTDIAAKWYSLHTADARMGHESKPSFDSLEDDEWLTGEVVRDGMAAILEVCNNKADKVIASQLGGIRKAGTRSKTRLRLAAVNPVPPINTKTGNIIEGTGVHWILVATVEDEGKSQIAVEIDPMIPSPGVNATAKITSKQFARKDDDEDWALGWKKGMAAILGKELPGTVPALQHLEGNDCGVWVLMMVWFIMAILRRKVDAEAAVQAVHDLHGSVAHFRKFLREQVHAAKDKAEAYAKAFPDLMPWRNEDQGPDIVDMADTKEGMYGRKKK